MTQLPLLSACHRCNGTGHTRSHDGQPQLCGSCHGAGALDRDCRICGQPAGPSGYCAGHDPETAPIPL